MDKYSELQSQAFQYHIERDEMEETHKVRLTQLESELRRVKSELSEKEANIAELQERSPDVGVLDQGLQEECSNLRSRLAYEEQRLKDELDRAASESARLRGEISNKEEEIAAVKAHMELLIQEHQSKHDELVAQLAEKTKLYEEQAQESKVKLGNLEQECLMLREELDSANELDLSNMYERQIKKARQENENLQTQVKQAEELSQQAQGRAVEAARQLQDSTAEVSSLKTALADLEEQKQVTIREVQNLNQVLETQLQVSKDETQRTREELQTATQEADRLRTEGRAIQEQLTSSLEELQSIHSTVKQLEEEVQRYHDEAAEASRLNQESSVLLNELVQENESLKSEIASARHNIQELEAAVTQLQTNVRVPDESQEQLQQMQEKLSRTNSDLSALQANLEATIIRLESTEQLLKDTEAQSSSLQSEKQALIDARIQPLTPHFCCVMWFWLTELDEAELVGLNETKEALLARAVNAEASSEALCTQLKDEAKKYADLLGHHNLNQKIRRIKSCHLSLVKPIVDTPRHQSTKSRDSQASGGESTTQTKGRRFQQAEERRC